MIEDTTYFVYLMLSTAALKYFLHTSKLGVRAWDRVKQILEIELFFLKHWFLPNGITVKYYK